MQTKIRNCCTNTNIVTVRYNCSSVTCAIITKIHRRRLKNTTTFVLKCQYLIIASAKTIISITMVEKHKISKYLQTFISVIYATIQSNLFFFLHNYNCAVDGHSLANKYTRKFQGLTNFRSTFIMLK